MEGPPGSAVIGRLRRRLYGLSFVDEFGPVYAVYTLWFNDNGISTSQVSTVFLIWAVVALALELPSGALADRLDRRKLLGSAFAIRAAAISLWLVWPTLTGVTIGAVMWAMHDAFASGAWEAMIHDELTAVNAADTYGPVMARIAQFSNLGLAAGTLLGAGLLRLDVPLTTLGWITVAAHAGSIALVITLPDVRWVNAASPVDEQTDRSDGQTDRVDTHDETMTRQWWTTLKAGLAEVATMPVIARLVGMGALLEGLFLIDEYIPLLARARGGSDAVAPVIFLIVWVGLLVGDEVAARRPSLPGPALGGALMLAMAVTALAFLGNAVWMLALIAMGYAVLETVWITTDARLQERTSGAVRATVTSVRGFGSALVSVAMFGVIGLLSNGDDPTPGLLVMVAVLLGAGMLIIGWLPAATKSRSRADRRRPPPHRA